METTADANSNNNQTASPIDVTNGKDGGVLKTIRKTGIEPDIHPAKGDPVFVHCSGVLKDTGVKFLDKGDQPFAFCIGQGQVIKGWDLAVVTMCRGEIASIECRSDYAFGAAGLPPKIPPNSTLIFEMELLHFGGEDLSPDRDGSIIKSVEVAGEKANCPDQMNWIKVHAVGSDLNGRVFYDCQLEHVLGKGLEQHLPEGVNRALRRINKGEKCRVTLKSPFNYGTQPPAEFALAPNEPIMFTLFLNEFEKIGLPVGPKTAFALFVQQQNNQFGQNSARNWARMNEDEKKPYFEMARADAARYQKELEIILARNECADNLLVPLEGFSLKKLFRRTDFWSKLMNNAEIKERMDPDYWKHLKARIIKENDGMKNLELDEMGYWVKGYHRRLSLWSLMRLKDGRTLSLELVNVFLELICRQRKDLTYLTSDQVNYYSEHMKIKDDVYINLKGKRLLFAPIQFIYHVTLAVVDFEKKSVEVFDTQNQMVSRKVKKDATISLLMLLQELWKIQNLNEEEFPPIKQWPRNVELDDAPKQKSDCDCGVFCSMLAKIISETKEFPRTIDFSQKHIPFARRLICQLLLDSYFV